MGRSMATLFQVGLHRVKGAKESPSWNLMYQKNVWLVEQIVENAGDKLFKISDSGSSSDGQPWTMKCRKSGVMAIFFVEDSHLSFSGIILE